MFSVFLLISLFIWFLNALGKNYTAVIEFPLTYTDIPEDRVFIGDLQEHLELRINAHGYAILRYKTFRKPVPVSFNVSAFTLNRSGQDSSRAFILTRYVKDQVSRQLPSELQLLEVKPDTLHFHFARSVSRMVKVMPDFSYEIDKQFTIKDGIVLEPDSVLVTGPDLILDTLNYVFTAAYDLGQISRNYSDKVKLRKYGDLEYNRSRVNASFELERYTEVQLSLAIDVLNVPDTIAVQTFPSRVKLTCNVGLSKYDRLDGSVIRAVVDYADIEEGTKLLDVSLRNIPLYLLSYEYYPKTVEFLKSRR